MNYLLTAAAEHHHDIEPIIEGNPYVLHFIVGTIFALTGVYARRFCNHLSHQLLVGFLLVLVESVAVVKIVG